MARASSSSSSAARRGLLLLTTLLLLLGHAVPVSANTECDGTCDEGDGTGMGMTAPPPPPPTSSTSTTTTTTTTTEGNMAPAPTPSTSTSTSGGGVGTAPTPSTSSGTTSGSGGSPAEPKLLWSEDFNVSGTLDSMTWNVETGGGGWGNGELQTYTEENAVVLDGSLQITAKSQEEDDGEVTFTSSRVNTAGKVEFQYGTVVARIQNPSVVAGLWPAFWTLGNTFNEEGGVSFYKAGEMDIMEMGQGAAIAEGVGNQRVVSAAHWERDDQYTTYAGYKDFPESLCGNFHDYVLDWTPTSITTYVDDTEVWKMDISESACADCEEFHRPHFLILNLAVGGGFTSGTSSSSSGSSGCGTSSSGGDCSGLRTADDITAPLPATMSIDYVRLYDNGYAQFPGAAAPQPPAGGSGGDCPPDTVPAPVAAPGPAPLPVAVPAPVPGASVPAPIPDAGGSGNENPDVAPCYICQDGGVSSIQNSIATVSLPSELATIVGASMITCGRLEQFAETDAELSQDECYLLDVELIRIACGCPNAQAPAASPTEGGVVAPPTAGGAVGPTDVAPSAPAAGGSGGIFFSGSSSKGKSGKSGGKSGKSGKSKGSKKGGSGAGSEQDAFFAASSTRPKGRRSRGSVLGATITVYGLAQLL